MGTHGYYCFRYKRLYYVVHNHYDSYPHDFGLGEKLVTQLRNLDPQDLRNLLDNIIVVYEQYPFLTYDIIERLRNIILQHPAYFEKIKRKFVKFQRATMDDASMFNEWMNNTFVSQRDKWDFLFELLFANITLRIDKALSFGFISVALIPDVIPPETDMIIEWIYVIDLDNETFLVKNWTTSVEFDYHGISQNWATLFD